MRDKIRADHERALQEAKEKLRKSREELQAEIQTEKNKVVEDLKKKDSGPKPLPPVPMPKVVGVSDGEPLEPDVKEKRDKIREVSWCRFIWKPEPTAACVSAAPPCDPEVSCSPHFHRPGQVRLSRTVIRCRGNAPERSPHLFTWSPSSYNHKQKVKRRVWKRSAAVSTLGPWQG